MAKNEVSGAVVVEFIIDKNGNVSQAQALRSSDRRFETAAVQAVLQWKFQPGERDGRKVSIRASQLIEFNLDAIPVYPRSLLIEQVEGKATVEFFIDRQGQAVQIKVISATRPEFGYAAQAALETAAFAPPFDDAPPPKAPRQMVFTFTINGKSDVRLDEWVRNHLDQMRHGMVFPPASTLSKPLVQKLRNEPIYPKGIPPEVRTGNAVVEFIVDGKGKVHLPRIVSSSREEFGFAAVQAVIDWTYEPPLSDIKSDRVLVEETIVFNSPARDHK